ncbi:MAG: hypothetical protein ACRD99_00510 [Nitrososphaera sp.]
MYKNAADALTGLVSGMEKEVARLPWRIEMSDRHSMMENGIDYFYVEVTFGNGVQYGIPAYGDEARELRERALMIKGAAEMLLQPLAAQ